MVPQTDLDGDATDPLGIGGSEDEDVLSIGMDNLNGVFEGGGLREGSVVLVVSDPSSQGNAFIGNMVAKRSAYYYTLSRSRESIIERLGEMKNCNLDYVALREINTINPIEAVQNELEQGSTESQENGDGLELPQNGSIIINPVNPIEKAGLDEYRRILHQLREKVVEARGLLILHAVTETGESGLSNRWFTEHFADTVFTLQPDTSGQQVKEYVSVSKLHPLQSLVGSDERVFEIERGLDIDIAASRNVST